MISELQQERARNSRYYGPWDATRKAILESDLVDERRVERGCVTDLDAIPTFFRVGNEARHLITRREELARESSEVSFENGSRIAVNPLDESAVRGFSDLCDVKIAAAKLSIRDHFHRLLYGEPIAYGEGPLDE